MTPNTITLPTTTPVTHRLRHPHIAAAIDECRLLLAAGDGANMLLGCGPTGVGKTTLGTYLVEAELKDQATAMADHPAFVPAIRVEAPSSGEKEFSWSLFYRLILAELEGELRVTRTAYGVNPETNRVVRSTGQETRNLSGLRMAVISSLKNRRTRFIVVDEAAHIFRLCHDEWIEKQLDTLKSLSNACGVQWVLLGSYDLFENSALSGQLSRRAHIIHFSRYRQDIDADARAFRGCVKRFCEWIPALQGIDLLRYTEVLHDNSLGCVGTLWSIMKRLGLFVAHKGWSEETLRSALLTEAQVTRILQEIVDGEDRIAPGLNRSLAVSHPAVSRKIA